MKHEHEIGMYKHPDWIPAGNNKLVKEGRLVVKRGKLYWQNYERDSRGNSKPVYSPATDQDAFDLLKAARHGKAYVHSYAIDSLAFLAGNRPSDASDVLEMAEIAAHAIIYEMFGRINNKMERGERGDILCSPKEHADWFRQFPNNPAAKAVVKAYQDWNRKRKAA